METWIWITIAVIAVLLVLTAFAWLTTRQTRGSAHRRAEAIRGDVRERASDFGERTAVDAEREDYRDALHRADEIDPRTGT